MAVQTVQTVSRAGLNMENVAVAADAGLSDKWAGTGLEFLYVSNGGAGSITATFPIQFTVDGQTVASKTVSIPNGKHMLIGPFPTSTYNDSQGNVNVNWSAVTSVTISVVRLGS